MSRIVLAIPCMYVRKASEHWKLSIRIIISDRLLEDPLDILFKIRLNENTVGHFYDLRKYLEIIFWKILHVIIQMAALLQFVDLSKEILYVYRFFFPIQKNLFEVSYFLLTLFVCNHCIFLTFLNCLWKGRIICLRV